MLSIPRSTRRVIVIIREGVAQVDAFELLFTSEDDPEGGYGEEVTPSDFRYIGYRVITPEGQSGTCDHLLEFTFTTWVSQSYEDSFWLVWQNWLICLYSPLIKNGRKNKSELTWSSFRFI